MNIINKIKTRSLIDFILDKPYIENPIPLWDRLGLDYVTSIGIPRWFLFFTIIYIAFIQLLCGVVSFALKIINDYAFAAKKYEGSGSSIAAKYAIESLQIIIANLGYISVMPIFIYYLVKIIKSFKK